MTVVPDAAASLLLMGLFFAGVLVAQAVAARNISLQDVPSVLRSRVALSNHLRPWLLATAGAMILAGVVTALG